METLVFCFGGSSEVFCEAMGWVISWTLRWPRPGNRGDGLLSCFSHRQLLLFSCEADFGKTSGVDFVTVIKCRPFLVGDQRSSKCMVIWSDFWKNTLFGLVSYNDPYLLCFVRAACIRVWYAWWTWEGFSWVITYFAYFRKTCHVRMPLKQRVSWSQFWSVEFNEILLSMWILKLPTVRCVTLAGILAAAKYVLTEIQAQRLVFVGFQVWTSQRYSKNG